MDSLSTMGGGLCPVVGGVDGVDRVMSRCRARMEAMTSASVVGGGRVACWLGARLGAAQANAPGRGGAGDGAGAEAEAEAGAGVVAGVVAGGGGGEGLSVGLNDRMVSPTNATTDASSFPALLITADVAEER